MIGKSILHYKIIEKLGEGGMGVVYLAEDTKLKRQVAIKFLPGHIAASSDERKRFEIEAQAAAALNHPNIATIHAIEETEENLFLVMEYISGKHLKDHINGKPLPVEEAVDIARQIARGLQAAHKKEIVHRDIKSANIMRTDDGHVRIMDFGLAKFRGSAQLTQIGTTVGTAAYMSPEQARGEEADHRADIWSFGVVFYEMLTGHPPFRGEYEQALIYNLLNEDITPALNVNPEIPQAINNVIDKCLQKDKVQRYRSMDNVLADLKQGSASDIKSAGVVVSQAVQANNSGLKNTWVKWSAIVAVIVTLLLVTLFLFNPSTDESGISKKMLVVLPFENLGNTDNEYFADGITSEITSRLSGLSGLGVIARTSASQYRNTSKTLKQIAEELGVEYVLMGTVQWQQIPDRKRVRVHSELIQVQSSTQIWSKPYDADFADAFQLQSDIASQVASALNLKLLSNERKVLDEKLTDNALAYDFFLRANNFYDGSYSKEDWKTAKKMYEKAFELDPRFAAAYARLANLLVDMYWFYYDRSPEIIQTAKEYVDKAKGLNADHFLVREAMGWYYYHGLLDYKQALAEFDASLETQPNNPGVYMGIGSVLRRQGKMREALEVLKKAVEVDPRSAVNQSQVGETLLLLRRYNEAVTYFDYAISLAPDQGAYYHWKAWTLLSGDGNIDEAEKLIETNLSKLNSDKEFQFYIRYQLAISAGNFDKALAICEQFEDLDYQFFFYPQSLTKAKVYEFLNRKNEVEKNYQKALDITKQKLTEHPDDSRYNSALGLSYAGLGQKREAIRAGEYATELMPLSREAWRGGWRLYNLAEIYCRVGEYNKALSLLDKVLSIPLEISVKIIDMDPTWDPLRNMAEYRQLVKKYTLD